VPSINNRPVVAPKVKAQAAPGQLIDRAKVAAALDRNGDNKVSRDELSAAGITNLDPGAIDEINRGGEEGDEITVNELARALGSDSVRLSGEGNVAINGGYAQFRAGRLEKSAPWSFPYVQGVQTLDQVRQIAPSAGWSAYNPDSPSSEFTYDAISKDRFGQPLKYQEGMRLQANEYAGQDGYVHYHGVNYDELSDILRSKATAIRDITANAKDPEIQQIHDEVNRVLFQTDWSASSRRDRARDLYNALARFDNIDVPQQPESRLTALDQSLKTAAARVDDQTRITRDVPVDRARTAVQKEVDRLHGITPAKILTGVGVGAAAGAIAFFAASLALPIAAGIGLGGLLVGGLIAHFVSTSKAKGYENDLEVLKTIDPAKNKRDLAQYNVVGYKIVQDARTADTLAKLRAYSEAADGASKTVDAMTNKVANETHSLQNMESLVHKYYN
jgi:hypothetical protein